MNWIDRHTPTAWALLGVVFAVAGAPTGLALFATAMSVAWHIAISLRCIAMRDG